MPESCHRHTAQIQAENNALLQASVQRQTLANKLVTSDRATSTNAQAIRHSNLVKGYKAPTDSCTDAANRTSTQGAMGTCTKVASDAYAGILGTQRLRLAMCYRKGVKHLLQQFIGLCEEFREIERDLAQSSTH
eukprot:1905985-Pleurochrysis_carterae.AAC.1